jgi:hypothetical protein
VEFESAPWQKERPWNLEEPPGPWKNGPRILKSRVRAPGNVEEPWKNGPGSRTAPEGRPGTWNKPWTPGNVEEPWKSGPSGPRRLRPR